MNSAHVYVVRIGSSEDPSIAFSVKEEAIEHVAERARKNYGRCPAMKIEKAFNVPVPDRPSHDDPRLVYALLEYKHENSTKGTILDFHATVDEAREAIRSRSRYFFDEEFLYVPRLQIAEIELR